MYYVSKILSLLNLGDFIFLPAIAAVELLFCILNWGSNVYRKQNKALSQYYKIIRSFPAKTAEYVSLMPEDYRRMWRAYINSKVEKPSLVFEFVTKRNKLKALWLFVLAAIASTTYVVVFAVLDTSKFGYLMFQVAFWLTFGLMIVINKAIAGRNLRNAKRIFAQLVTQLNANSEYTHCENIVDETVRQINQLNKYQVTDVEVSKASELLRNKGLDANRSVEQQRKLNGALNGLLQAYANNSKQNVF